MGATPQSIASGTMRHDDVTHADHPNPEVQRRAKQRANDMVCRSLNTCGNSSPAMSPSRSAPADLFDSLQQILRTANTNAAAISFCDRVANATRLRPAVGTRPIPSPPRARRRELLCVRASPPPQRTRQPPGTITSGGDHQHFGTARITIDFIAAAGQRREAG